MTQGTLCVRFGGWGAASSAFAEEIHSPARVGRAIGASRCHVTASCDTLTTSVTVRHERCRATRRADIETWIWGGQATMEYFAGGHLGRTILIRFDKGDLLLERLEEIAAKEGIKSAVVVSGMGTFERCALHMITTTGYPGHDQFVTIERPLELLSVNGLIADGKAHLHVAVSDTERAYGGHLEPGSRVCYLAEICLVELPDARLVRIPHPNTGTMQLKQK